MRYIGLGVADGVKLGVGILGVGVTVGRGVKVGGPVTTTVGTGVSVRCGVNVGSVDANCNGDGGGVNGDGGGVSGETGDSVGSTGGGHPIRNRVITMIAAMSLSFMVLSL